jgi:biotin carboxyl carrier protein
VRVDTAGYAGYTVGSRYDPLLAKVITDGGTLEEAGRRAVRALAEFDIAGVPTNVALLQALLRALLQAPGPGAFDVGWVDAHAAELAVAEPQESGPVPGAVRSGHTEVRAPLAGTVVSVTAVPGSLVAAGDELLVIEAMKMEHEVRAPAAGLVQQVPVTAGATVQAGAVLIVLAESADEVAGPTRAGDIPLDHVRADLAEVRERHRIGLDQGRPEMTARRHAAGRRTARENIADLVDEGTFTEYGALTIAAQCRRRSLDDLIVRTPADGLVAGTARIDGRPVAVMSYDYSVLAGTQGFMNHRKTDRLLELADRERLPVVIFAEGGGGRPGDTDTTAVAGLDVPTFRLTARLSGRVPLVAVVSGYCFAGNAALAGACDVIIATPEASLGMGGPAMIRDAAGHPGPVRHGQRAGAAGRFRRRGADRPGPPRRARGRAAGQQPAVAGRGDRRRRRRQGHGVPAAVRGAPAAGRLTHRHPRLHGGARGGADGYRAALRRDVRGRRAAHRPGLRGGFA